MLNFTLSSASGCPRLRRAFVHGLSRGAAVEVGTLLFSSSSKLISEESEPYPLTKYINMNDLKTVLIVDDSSLSRMMIRGFIGKKYPECVIYEAPNGDAAVNLRENETPQLITLDVNMPGMNSLEAAVQLQKLYPAARLAIITANIQQSVRKNLQGLGILFLAVIEKPITENGMQKIFDAL